MDDTLSPPSALRQWLRSTGLALAAALQRRCLCDLEAWGCMR
jgi:hypothetical protein